MGSYPQESGRARRPRCRSWCNSSRSAERLLVFYLLSLHFYFCMVYASARPIPNGFSSLDSVNNGTGIAPDGLSSNIILSPRVSPTPTPTANSHSEKLSFSRPYIIIPTVIAGIVLSMAAIKLYLTYKKNHTVSPPLPEKKTGGEVDPGTHEAASPSFTTAIDTSSNSDPSSVSQQAKRSHPSLDHQRRRWKLSIFSCCRKGAAESDAKSAPTSTPPRDILTETVSLSRSDVKRATRNFAKKIGSGGFGPVYYGRLPGSGLEVAVKVPANNSRQGRPRDFTTEGEILSRARHPNLVSLLGCCEERSRCMLVYEYLPGGTLQNRLYGRRSNPPLDWRARLKIAAQAAKGLEYLHNECVPSIIHCDLKSNNILLTKSGDAKLTDFGLCKSLEEMPLKCSVKARTSGYLDPEYYKSMRLTHKSDVFSFGIVLLELISAREPTDTNLPHKEEWILADWVRNNLVEGKLEAIVDKALDSNLNNQSMWWVAELAMTCVEPQSIYRPTISEVVLELDAIRAEHAHRPRIPQTTPSGTPHSVRRAPSLAHQSPGITRSTQGDTPGSSRPAPSPAYHRQDSISTPSTQGDTPDSSRPAPSPAHQRQDSSSTLGTSGDTPDSFRTAPSAPHENHGSSITLSTPGDTPDSSRPTPSLAHQRQDSNITLSTPGNTPDYFRIASPLGHHSQTLVQT